jgi:inner membrane transporter RhtA
VTAFRDTEDVARSCSDAVGGGPVGAAGAPAAGGLLGAVPPTGLVLAGVASTQVGAAFAKTLFDELGPAGTVLLRVLFAAVVLLVVSRPGLRGRTRSQWRIVLVFGAVLAGMNLSFYAAIERIPLGVAVTLEFVGPLGVAIAGSRRAVDALWVLLAAAGVVLLGGGSAGEDAAGIGLALLAGAFWAAYILASARVGQRFQASTGLALAMGAAALLLLPVGVLDGGAALLEPRALLAGAAVAMLSSAIPYTLEMEALRRLPARVFGVLMSLEPAVAALAGLVVLGELLAPREWIAVALVIAASVGATRRAAPEA